MACGSTTAGRPRGSSRPGRSMAARYASNPLVAAMDIMNEPRRSRVGWRVLTPTWGTGRTTDIAAMYTAAGNLIHEVSPDVLIICEGLGYAADLTGVARHPVRLERPGKVVYSLHDYSWFHPRDQPRAAYSRADAPGRRVPPQPSRSPRCGSASSATTPGRWPDSPACGGTTSKPGSPSTTWTGAGGRSTRTQPRGTVPVTGQHRSDWGDPEPWGLLAPDWRGVANPAVLDILKDDDPGPHRSRRCTLTEGSHACPIRAATGPAPVAAPEDKSGTALAWIAYLAFIVTTDGGERRADATGLGMRCHTTRSRPRPASGWRAPASRTPPPGAR